MKPIIANITDLRRLNTKTVGIAISATPTADVVEVVRFKDCKWYQLYHLACIHPYFNGWINVDGFCSYGEKRDAE